MIDTQSSQQDIECIIPPKGGRGGLYIGNLEAALSLPTLKRLTIKAAISMAKGGFLSHSSQDLPNYLYIQAYDRQDFDLTPYFETTYEFIEKHRHHTNVLVHCLAGISRSVTIVIAYLMRKTGGSLVDCYCQVKKCRNKVQPNEGFLLQLKHYQQRLKKEQNGHNVLGSGFSKTPPPRFRKACSPLQDSFLQSQSLESEKPDSQLVIDRNKIQPINIEARINHLRTRYSRLLNNPQDDVPTDTTLGEANEKGHARKLSGLLLKHGRQDLKLRSNSCLNKQLHNTPASQSS